MDQTSCQTYLDYITTEFNYYTSENILTVLLPYYFVIIRFYHCKYISGTIIMCLTV